MALGPNNRLGTHAEKMTRGQAYDASLDAGTAQIHARRLQLHDSRRRDHRLDGLCRLNPACFDASHLWHWLIICRHACTTRLRACVEFWHQSYECWNRTACILGICLGYGRLAIDHLYRLYRCKHCPCLLHHVGSICWTKPLWIHNEA